MEKKQRKKWKQGFAAILTAVMVFGMVPNVGTIPKKVEAANGVKTMNLDTAYLTPSDSTWDANDHKVWFGQYGNTPTAFRVLKAEGTTMMLDCDTILLTKAFDEDCSANTEQNSGDMNEWTGSDLEKWLNGTDYYENTSVFTSGEQSVIQQTSLLASAEDYDVNGWLYKDYAANDYIYLLSEQEANDLYADNAARVKTGGNAVWWLRSAYADYSKVAGIVGSDGNINNYTVNSSLPGVSPALNLNLKSVLFASANEVSKSSDTLTAVTDGSGTKEWKLTLLDSAKTVKVMDGSYVTQSGDTITVPYTYTGSDISQISVMITSGAYAAAGTEILYYGKLNTTLAASGTGSFTLPSGLPEGYKMYILAEDVNGEKCTDYASAPVEIVPVFAVTVNDGTADHTEYAEGETVTITADTAPEGKRFKEWTGVGGLTFTDGTSETSATAKFTMPANAVTVTATYEDIPHTHAWDTAWTYDDTYHWHKCTADGCDGSVTAKAEHKESVWITDKAATTTSEGEKHTECTVCHTIMQTETIPKIVEPEKPIEPTPPVEPEKPTEPTIPTEPETPTVPETPIEPGKEFTGIEPVEEDLMKPIKAGKNYNKISWNKVKGADGYYIFAAQCNTKSKKYPLKLVKDVTSGKTTSFIHQGLKKATWYKYRVVAYKITDGKRKTIARSFVLHSITNGGKYVNPSSVKVSKSKVTLKKGKSFTVKAKVVLPKGKKTKWHTSKIHFISSNTKIATVSSKGKIKAKKKGSCTIYAIAQNGVSKKIKVTVK